MRQPIEKQIVLADTLVSYYEAQENRPTAPAIVFLHGWRSQGSVWFPVWEKFLGEGSDVSYALYALDLPGFGKSEAPRAVFMLADYAAAVEAFVAALGLTRVVLVGHSFGGRIAIKIAAARKLSLAGLVLVAAAGFRSHGAMLAVKRFVAKILKPLFAFSFMRPLRARLYRLIGAEDYVATPKLRETFVNITQEDLTALLPSVKTRTLLVWGEHDTDTPAFFGERMHDAISPSTLVVLKDAGHFSFLDQPEAFTRELAVFLENENNEE